MPLRPGFANKIFPTVHQATEQTISSVKKLISSVLAVDGKSQCEIEKLERVSEMWHAPLYRITIATETIQPEQKENFENSLRCLVLSHYREMDQVEVNIVKNISEKKTLLLEKNPYTIFNNKKSI
ncbi:MAG: hypothetical protein MHPSP_003681 [Paramarteilia canceri]